ncbi:response regulator [Thermodesulfobacteriota bacterium]
MGDQAADQPRVLIVDDAKTNIDVLVETFKKEYKLGIATNGPKALQYVEHIIPDLILLDIMMPEMDGYAVCEQLKANPATAAVPIIFLTAKTDPDSIVKGLEAGGVDYVTKPFTIPELVSRVRTHLELKQKQDLLASMNQVLEQKVAERTAQLAEANRKLAVLEQAKSDFLALISHELRTPLNGIVMLTEFLADSELNQEQSEYIEDLKVSTDRLQHFAEIALLITHLQADAGQLDATLMPVAEIVAQALGTLQTAAAEKQIVIAHAAAGDGLQVSGDRELLVKCLEILLDNAVKHSPEGGRVEIASGRQNGRITVCVSDGGPGFAEQALTGLFEMFSGTDVMHHTEGLGLGLVVARLILDAHSAGIEARNRPEGGAQVVLSFPAAPERGALTL